MTPWESDVSQSRNGEGRHGRRRRRRRGSPPRAYDLDTDTSDWFSDDYGYDCDRDSCSGSGYSSDSYFAERISSWDREECRHDQCCSSVCNHGITRRGAGCSVDGQSCSLLGQGCRGPRGRKATGYLFGRCCPAEEVRTPNSVSSRSNTSPSSSLLDFQSHCIVCNEQHRCKTSGCNFDLCINLYKNQTCIGPKNAQGHGVLKNRRGGSDGGRNETQQRRRQEPGHLQWLDGWFGENKGVGRVRKQAQEAVSERSTESSPEWRRARGRRTREKAKRKPHAEEDEIQELSLVDNDSEGESPPSTAHNARMKRRNQIRRMRRTLASREMASPSSKGDSSEDIGRRGSNLHCRNGTLGAVGGDGYDEEDDERYVFRRQETYACQPRAARHAEDDSDESHEERERGRGSRRVRLGLHREHEQLW
jgi:hypothetical protein